MGALTPRLPAIFEAFQNWQLINYVAGINGLTDQETEIDMAVIQPRAFHRDGPVRRWRVTAAELSGYISRLADAASVAVSPNPTANSTPEGCEHCRGRRACEALQRAAYVAADKGQHYAPLDLSPHALGLELRTLKRAQSLLNARITGLEAQTEAAIKSGTLVPFWILDSVPGRLSWTKPPAEIFALGDMLGLKLQKDPEPITPTQAKAAAKAAKVSGEIFNAYAARATSAIKLIADDGSKAHLIFTTSNT